MAICPTSAEAGLVSQLMETVDCHVRVLVHDAYRNLAGPDTLFATAFTGMLTIYVALLGYQLMFGRGGLRVTELPVTVLKIGLVLAFLTSWAAYQTVFFDLLFEGPRTLMQVFLTPMARAGSGFDGDVYGGIERAYGDISRAAAVYGGQAGANANILQGGPMLGSGLLWLTGIGMLLISVGLILAVKVVLAFLLAIGPIAVGFFLFDATRGLFEGWLRAAIGFALAPLAVNVFGGAMLMMLQPFLAKLAANAGRNLFDMGVVITIAIIVAVFAIVMALALRAGAMVAAGIGDRGGATTAPPTPAANAQADQREPGGSRAEEFVARAARAADTQAIDLSLRSDGGESRRAREAAEAVGDPTPVSQRLGQTYRRTPRPPAGEDRGRP